MKAEKWYQRRLAKYFTENFEPYEDIAEFWNDPAENCWLFDIPELGQKIELLCRDNGKVEETRYPILKQIDILESLDQLWSRLFSI